MSKIGEKTIEIPKGIEVQIKDNTVNIKGKDGELSLPVPLNFSLKIEENVISLKRTEEDKKTRANHGLFRSLLKNAILGVEKPWTKSLEVVGTGYRVKLQGEDLFFEVGFSHPVIFKKISGVKFEAEDGKVILTGVDRQLVGQIAHKIKSIKKPDPYKGKGIKYEGERLKLRPGKKAKAAEGAK